MNTTLPKPFLPSIHKKGKANFTPKNDLPEKKPPPESFFFLKTKGYDKTADIQKTQPRFLIKTKVLKQKGNEDFERLASQASSQTTKTSFVNLFDGQNLTSSKRLENTGRQTRFDTSLRHTRERKDSFTPDHSQSASISPEKRSKTLVGHQSLRSKSEFSRIKVHGFQENRSDFPELKVIDSMEIMDDNEEDVQCEIDREGIGQTTLNTKAPKKKKGFTALCDMVPLNLEEERRKFFELNFKYNPQFEYNIQNFKQQFDKPHTKYMKIAKMILNACIKEYGNDERYLETTGGRLITREETEAYFESYIQDLGLEGCLDIVFSEKTVAPTSVIHEPNGKSRVVISLPIAYRENRIMGVMHHEIGTHFIRKYNDRLQPWFKNRKKFDLKAYLIIEEGLAALNQTLEAAMDKKQIPYLWNSALHYYSCYMSSILGLEALFKDLEKYIKDPLKRWRECVRVKRGIADTTQPGGMYKDQVYLRGALEILKKRKKIDFILLHAGKINVKDLHRMMKNGNVKTENIKLPSFLKNLEKYKSALDYIADANFIDTLK